ncbi:MAG: hypothetical protein LCH84_05735 [Gemmatimonadetes bacterium]|nr:hypothetical protein [Gemmatimonadota bacterium]
MAGHEQHSDKGAAFTGLIGGVIVIGAILYGITMWTNAKFAGHKAEAKTGAVTVVAPSVG